ncbi:hypothetical protein CRE_10121 [Caenorhabditis remanei]|uniref:Uncharacterized protein n=1 Tax=Caenorhabditis remanei TaxID=31234 RepID=E3M6B7_CAERE|nr:hypothetical protein CRE_10121 [Caenorhabditis remanei]
MEKMKIMVKQDNKTNKNGSDDEDPESGEGYPDRFEILYKLKRNPRLARTYLEFKRKKAVEELDHAVSIYVSEGNREDQNFRDEYYRFED